MAVIHKGFSFKGFLRIQRRGKSLSSYTKLYPETNYNNYCSLFLINQSLIKSQTYLGEWFYYRA